jgi:hypothetical protein
VLPRLGLDHADRAAVRDSGVRRLRRQSGLARAVTIIAIEIGLLTPPLGIAVFVVKANLEDQSISAWDIFKGTRR